MTAPLDFRAWTFAQVEDRLLEAAVVSRRLPAERIGPSVRLTWWPEHIGLYDKGNKVRVTAAPDELSRFQECQAWLNTYLDEEERKLIRGWLICKTTYRKNRLKSGKTLENMAANMQVNSKTLRRAVIRLCQHIADRLNASHMILRELDAGRLSEIHAQAAAYRVAPARPGRTPRAARDSSSPLLNDRSPEGIRRVEKAIARANKRNRRMKKARSKARRKPAKKPAKKGAVRKK